MSLTAFARVSSYALLCCAWACGGGDSTGPGNQQVSVELTATPDHLTAPGNLEFVATVVPPLTVRVSNVKFFEKTVGSDSAPQEIGVDSVAPFTYSRSISNADDNGTKEFTAKAFSGETEMASSNAVRVAVNLPDVPLAANFFYSHPRITTAGKIWFLVAANKRVARVELYNASTKIAETTPAADTSVITASVTAADNGTQTYVVKAYDAGGAVAESRVYSVIVDIRWTLLQNVGAFHSREGVFIATDATNAIYYAGTTDSFDTFLVKYDADGHEQWTRTFGGADREYANSIVIDGSGRVYMAGTIYDRAQVGVSQCFVNVYDAGGSLLATRQIKPASTGPTSSCIAAVDASNNLYVTGHGADATRGWWFALKYDSDGNLLWNREISATPVPGSEFSGSELTGLAVDALGGGVYIGGYTGGSFDGAPNRGPRDLFVLKFDADGNTVWASQYGTTGVLIFSAQLTADPNGGVYVAGSTDDPNQRFSHSNALIASYDAGGTRRWVKTLDGGWYDQGSAITVNSSGVYLVGATYGAVVPGHEITEWSQVVQVPGTALLQGTSDIFVAKFSVVGDLQGIRMLGTSSAEFGQSIVTAAGGDIYIAGGRVYDAPNTINTPLLARLHDAP
jgi:hypothetical protein